MKILKIFGIVVGIHVFALILIFANPGCSSSTRPATAPETVARSEPAPQIIPPSISGGGGPALMAAPMNFNPDAPAVAATSGGGFRVAPTRPGTPVADVLTAQPMAEPVTPVITHTVVSGDNLWNLSKKHGLTTAQLAAANGIKVNASLKPGQKLIIPSKPGTALSAPVAAGTPGASPKGGPDPVAAAKANPNQMKHVVQSGEVLGTIARKYGVTVGQLAELNNISDPAKVKAGTELLIPDWQQVNKSGKAGQKSGAESAKGTPATKAPAQPPPTINPEREPLSSPRPANEIPMIPVIPVDDSPLLTPAPRR